MAICKEMGRNDIARIVEDRQVCFMEDGFLALNDLRDNDFIDLAKSQFVLSKIKLIKADLIKIGAPEKVVTLSEKTMITFKLKNYADMRHSDRAKRCPVKKQCDALFNRLGDSAYNCFTCVECPIFIAERTLEYDGKFFDRDSISFGVTQYGF